MKQLTSAGVGNVKKQAEPLTEDHEKILWDKKIFDVETAQGLLYLTFFYNCKLFGLRGGDEHRSLVREQFQIGTDDADVQFLNFIGRSSKNVQGGLKQRKVATKNLKIFAKSTQGDRCIVAIYSKFFQLIPDEGPFYRKPLKGIPPKFGSQVVGRNKLAGLVKEMCTMAGFKGNFTNHSGKVTCATRLFEHNIDEQLIKRQTGHRSDSVRQYKRPNSDHDKKISSILQPPSPEKAAKSSLAKKQCTAEDAMKTINNSISINKENFESNGHNKTISLTFNFNL